MDESSLTPIQQVGGFLMKRDDLFAPYGDKDVNGGKLRQCIMLLKSLPKKPDAVLTYCSIHSPQAPITAAVCQALGVRCRILYGGTQRETLQGLPMPRLSMRHGAELLIYPASGRHNVLYSRAKALRGENDFIVQYGINIADFGDVLLSAVARQVENIPDKLDNLYMVCGSGITATGVLLGIKRYGKAVGKVHLVCTAPDRSKFIHETLRKHDADREFLCHSLYGQKGFVYEKGVKAVIDGVAFHPHYEAKMLQWMVKGGHYDKDAKNLVWITGAEPKLARPPQGGIY